MSGFGLATLKHEGGMYHRFGSLTASNLSKDEVSIFCGAEDGQDLGWFVQEVVEKIMASK